MELDSSKPVESEPNQLELEDDSVTHVDQSQVDRSLTRDRGKKKGLSNLLAGLDMLI